MFDLDKFKSRMDSVRNLKEAFKLLGPLFEEEDSQVFALLRELSSNLATAAKIIDVDRDAAPTPGQKKAAIQTGPVLKVQIKIPKPKELAENWAFLNQNSDKLEGLEYTLVKFNHDFRGDPDLPKLLTGIKAKIAQLNTSKSAALKVLERVGNKHIPTELKSLVGAVVPKLKKALKGQYKDLQELVYVVPVDKNKQKEYGNLAFYYYLRFTGLKQEEGAYPDYCIVFTGRVEGTKLSLWLNVQPKFKLPLMFPLGASITGASESQVFSVIENRLAISSAQSIINPLPLPLTRKEVKTSPLLGLKMVKSADVKGNTIIVTLKPGSKFTDVNAVHQMLMPILRGMLNVNETNEQAVRYTPMKSGGVITAMKYTLHPTNKGLNMHQLVELQEALSLTEDEIDALTEILRGRG
jgi:hypothetical protein